VEPRRIDVHRRVPALPRDRLPEAESAIDRIVGGYYGMQAALFGHLDAAANQPSAARWLGATLLWGRSARSGLGSRRTGIGMPERRA
jgi:hypothetical protein